MWAHPMGSSLVREGAVRVEPDVAGSKHEASRPIVERPPVCRAVLDSTRSRNPE